MKHLLLENKEIVFYFIPYFFSVFQLIRLTWWSRHSTLTREPYPEEILWEEKSERLKASQASKKRTTGIFYLFYVNLNIMITTQIYFRIII